MENQTIFFLILLYNQLRHFRIQIQVHFFIQQQNVVYKYKIFKYNNKNMLYKSKKSVKCCQGHGFRAQCSLIET